MKGTILFVDDERNVLQGLRRSLHRKRGDWTMHFACGPEEAVDLVNSVAFDVVVSDMRMPGMNGAALLAKVLEVQPSAIRFILSGQSEREAIFSAIGVSHQFFSKPCDIESLVGTIETLLTRREKLPSHHIEPLTSLQCLPSPSENVAAISVALAGGTDEEVADAIASDVSASIKVLQLTNSTYFGHTADIVTPHKAVGMLGRGLVTELFEKGYLTNSMPVEAANTNPESGAPHRHQEIDNSTLTCGLRSATTPIYTHFAGLCGTSAIGIESSSEADLAYLLALWGLPDQLVGQYDEPGETLAATA